MQKIKNYKKDTIAKSFRFYKTVESQWFIDFPEWKGENWELEMVMGADILCELIAQGESEFIVGLTNDEPIFSRGYCKLADKPEEGGGRYYDLVTLNGLEHDLQFWLCHVTTFIFGGFPEKIYFY